MNKKILITFLLLLFVCSLPVFAQDEEDEYIKDNLEVGLYGGFGLPAGDVKNWNDSLGAASKYLTGLEIGYFASLNVVTGFNFTFVEFKVDSEDPLTDGLTHRVYNPNLYIKYLFQSDGNFMPYVKGAIGLDFAKFTTSVENVNGNRYRQISYDPSLSFAFGAGAFYYTHDYAGLFLEANYHIGQTKEAEYTYGSTTATFGTTLNYIDIHAGIRVLFGSDE